MSNQHRLPQEICDHIIDLFQGDSEMLKRCCLVSKSWVPRTQKRLFSHVAFKAVDYPKWRRAFPDPRNSPACYTHTLMVDGPLGSAEEREWIESFSRVERLIVEGTWTKSYNPVFLDPFRKLAPSLKSLCVNSALFPLSYVFDLICFLPLLENLTVWAHNINDRSNARIPTPANSPALTGVLKLFASRDVEVTSRLLLGLRGGLRFRELHLSCCHVQGLTSVEELVMACSSTLKFLDIDCEIYATGTSSIDLSKAIQLREIVFRCRLLNCAWIITTLRTITGEHRNLQQISIRVPPIADPGHDIPTIDGLCGANPPLGWSDLDRLLVEFWELRSIPSKVVRSMRGSCPGVLKDWAKLLVPELMRRGIFDPVDVDESWGPEPE